MTTLAMFFGMIVCSLAQAVCPAWTWMGQAKPPLLLGAVLYYALSHNRRYMLQAAIVAGLLQDALGRIPLGYSSFAFCLAGLVTSKFKDLVFVQAWITHLLSGALSAAGVTLLLALLLGVQGVWIAHPLWILLKISGALLLGGLATPLVYRFMNHLDQILGNTHTRDA